MMDVMEAELRSKELEANTERLRRLDPKREQVSHESAVNQVMTRMIASADAAEISSRNTSDTLAKKVISGIDVPGAENMAEPSHRIRRVIRNDSTVEGLANRAEAYQDKAQVRHSQIAVRSRKVRLT